MKRRIYLVTGANGHLGSTLIRLLQKRHENVRGLILPGEKENLLKGVDYVCGDVRHLQELEPLFAGTKGSSIILLHTAGIVDISGKLTRRMYEVNVLGTRTILAACRKYKVDRLVYVSSVHAIPEGDRLHVIREAKQFSPDLVVGGYAKTKAQATREVLRSAGRGTNAVVVHPSGILGPYDKKGNYVVQFIYDYMKGSLPAGVKGGYDFVDVRDVAEGCLAAAEQGTCGECYILSNRHYEIREVIKMIRQIQGGRCLPVLPVWVARASVPLIGFYARCSKKRPLYTSYSLYTLTSNDRFSHDKATSELGYIPRDLYDTVTDTIRWLDIKNR